MSRPSHDQSAVLLVHTEYGAILNRQVAEIIKEREPDIPVFSTVLQATEKDKQDAQHDKVELLLPKVDPDDTRIDPTPDWLTFDHRSKYPHLPSNVRSIVGHADVTSRAALNIKDDRYQEAKVVLINDDISEDTQGNEAATGNNSALQNAQGADVVFSVGNKIFDHFKIQLGATPVDKRPIHFEYLPRPSKIFEHTKATYIDTKTMVVLSIGRVKSVDNLKGHDLAAKALDIVAVTQNVECRFRGIYEVQDCRTSHQGILQAHFRTTNLKPTLLPYGTLKDLHNDMLKAHLVLIPSEAEPFELVGLDAIAAGIPVLVSDRSGLADFMNKISREFYHSTVPMVGNEEDNVKQWARCIEQVLSNCETEFERAARCRDKLLSTKYWEQSHQQLIDSCLQRGESVQQPSEVQTRSTPVEESIQGREPLQSDLQLGGSSRELDSSYDDGNVTERTADQSQAEIGLTETPGRGAGLLYQVSPQFVGGPPLLPVVVDIFAQVLPSVKTPEDMLYFASALNTLSTVTESGAETLPNSLLRQIKPETKNITDLKTVMEAIEKLERFKDTKVIYVKEGSLIFYLKCTDVSGLGDLWFMYKNGELNNLLHSSLVSKETLQLLCAESISVKTTINIEDFRKVLVYLLTSPTAEGQPIPRLPQEYPLYQPHTHTTSSVLDVLHLDDTNLTRSSGKQHELHILPGTQTEDSQDHLGTKLDKLKIAGESVQQPSEVQTRSTPIEESVQGREPLQSGSDEPPSIAAKIVQQLSTPEYAVVLVGRVGHGKSASGNSILGRYGTNKAFRVSASGSPVTKTCSRVSAQVDGMIFHVIDTPGVMDTDAEGKATLGEISKCRQLCPNGVNAVLLVIPFGVKFTKEEETSIGHLKTLFGDNLFKYGIVVFTQGDRFEEAKEDGQLNSFNEYIHSQPPYFNDVLQKLRQRYVVFNNKLRGDAATPQRLQLIEHIRDVMRNAGNVAYRIPEITNAEGACFPATSTILMDGNHSEKMASLQLGTKVLSITDDITPAALDTVYFFSHAADDVIAPFVSITTVSGKTMHLSEGHYIYLGTDALKTGALVTAREVKVGDVVHVVDGPDQTPRPEEVTEVKTEIKRGLYCPHTLGGSLVVDGVCVSTYTEMFPPTVAHGLLWPIRVLYRFSPEMAGKIAQPQGEKGMPTWLGWLHDRYMAWF